MLQANSKSANTVRDFPVFLRILVWLKQCSVKQ
jgi:hypothetical protein